MIYVLLTLSLVFNFIFIIGLFVYFKYLRRYSQFLNIFKSDDAIIDKKKAIDFYGDSIL